MTTATTTRYVQPDWFTQHVFNPTFSFLARIGVPVRGARQLHVRKRVSGGTQVVPVNLLILDGVDYLVAPRGNTQWVRNLRAAGVGELRKGRKVEAFTAVELADDVKAPLLREYLRLWGFEVGKFFDGLDPKTATDADIAAMAPGFPVFRIERAVE